MTFNPIVPNASQSPGLFPPQNNANYNVLQNIINNEHVFNATPSPGDNTGTHRQMTVINRLDPTSLPAGTNGMFYTKNINTTPFPAWYDGTSLYILAAPRAFVTWDNLGNIKGNAFNIASIAKSSTATYLITFTVAIPSQYPQFSLSGYQFPFSSALLAEVISITLSGATMTAMTIRFVASNTGAEVGAITQGNLMVFGG